MRPSHVVDRPADDASLNCAATARDSQSHIIGTPEYRARHIAMLWSPAAWLDALQFGLALFMLCASLGAFIAALAGGAHG